jgi:hypothetical protein
MQSPLLNSVSARHERNVTSVHGAMLAELYDWMPYLVVFNHSGICPGIVVVATSSTYATHGRVVRERVPESRSAE